PGLPALLYAGHRLLAATRRPAYSDRRLSLWPAGGRLAGGSCGNNRGNAALPCCPQHCPGKAASQSRLPPCAAARGLSARRLFLPAGTATGAALPLLAREPCACAAGRSASALYSRNCSGSSARQPPLRFRRRRVGRSSGGARAAASIASSEQQDTTALDRPGLPCPFAVSVPALEKPLSPKALVLQLHFLAHSSMAFSGIGLMPSSPPRPSPYESGTAGRREQ